MVSNCPMSLLKPPLLLPLYARDTTTNHHFDRYHRLPGLNSPLNRKVNAGEVEGHPEPRTSQIPENLVPGGDPAVIDSALFRLTSQNRTSSLRLRLLYNTNRRGYGILRSYRRVW